MTSENQYQQRIFVNLIFEALAETLAVFPKRSLAKTLAKTLPVSTSQFVANYGLSLIDQGTLAGAVNLVFSRKHCTAS